MYLEYFRLKDTCLYVSFLDQNKRPHDHDNDNMSEKLCEVEDETLSMKKNK